MQQLTKVCFNYLTYFDDLDSFYWYYFTDVSAYKALVDSAYGAVKQNVEITEAETPIFKQLDIDVID